MAPASKSGKTPNNQAGVERKARMVKCACASCQCTVDMDRGVRKGNLVFCNQVCATGCTFEECHCEHDHCSV